jgi:hypothetical protein
MAVLTATQLTDIRADVGDSNSAFSDAELQRIWVRVANASDDETRWDALKAMIFEQLLNDASKMHDYTAGAVSHKLSQVYDQLEKRYKEYLPALEDARGIQRGMRHLKIRGFPHQDRTTPRDA